MLFILKKELSSNLQYLKFIYLKIENHGLLSVCVVVALVYLYKD